MPRIGFCVGVNGQKARFSAGLRGGQSGFFGGGCKFFVLSTIFCVKFFAMKKTGGKFLHDETGAVYYNGSYCYKNDPCHGDVVDGSKPSGCSSGRSDGSCGNGNPGTRRVYYNGRRVRGVYDQVADQVAAVASGCYIFNDENFKF